MEINEEILEIFKEFRILPADGICYLISLFHGYSPTYIPDEIKMKVNLTGIIAEVNKNLHWNVPLYNNQETNFSWVNKEYVSLFENANPDKKGNWREATTRLKKLFAKYPEIRKQDVIGATKLYLDNTNPKYIRLSHFFIEKGAGASKTQDILEWIDRYNEENIPVQGNTSITRKLQ